MPVQQVRDALRVPGQPLTAPLKAEMESRLGADLSDVRLHTGAAARASATEFGARAYTYGDHVVIGSGGADKITLAHELSHVLQQRQDPVPDTAREGGVKVSDPTDANEKAAAANAARVMSAPPPDRGTAPSRNSASPRVAAHSRPPAQEPTVQRVIALPDQPRFDAFWRIMRDIDRTGLNIGADPRISPTLNTLFQQYKDARNSPNVSITFAGFQEKYLDIARRVAARAANVLDVNAPHIHTALLADAIWQLDNLVGPGQLMTPPPNPIPGMDDYPDSDSDSDMDVEAPSGANMEIDSDTETETDSDTNKEPDE